MGGARVLSFPLPRLALCHFFGAGRGGGLFWGGGPGVFFFSWQRPEQPPGGGTRVLGEDRPRHPGTPFTKGSIAGASRGWGREECSGPKAQGLVVAASGKKHIRGGVAVFVGNKGRRFVSIPGGESGRALPEGGTWDFVPNQKGFPPRGPVFTTSRLLRDKNSVLLETKQANRLPLVVILPVTRVFGAPSGGPNTPLCCGGFCCAVIGAPRPGGGGGGGPKQCQGGPPKKHRGHKPRGTLPFVLDHFFSFPADPCSETGTIWGFLGFHHPQFYGGGGHDFMFIVSRYGFFPF